jgi:nitric oxide dioxygenase
MLEQALAAGRRVSYLHAALHGAAHAFRDHVEGLAKRHAGLRRLFCYSEPAAGDTADATGFVTPDLLAQLIADRGAVDAYVVGPKPFMQSVIDGLRSLGVPEQRIHYEFFGPKQALA